MKFVKKIATFSSLVQVSNATLHNNSPPLAIDPAAGNKLYQSKPTIRYEYLPKQSTICYAVTES